MDSCHSRCPPVNARAVEADEDAEVHRRPCGPPREAVSASPIVLLLHQDGQHALVLLILRLADSVLAVAHGCRRKAAQHCCRWLRPRALATLCCLGLAVARCHWGRPLINERQATSPRPIPVSGQTRAFAGARRTAERRCCQQQRASVCHSANRGPMQAARLNGRGQGVQQTTQTSITEGHPRFDNTIGKLQIAGQISPLTRCE